MGQSLIEAYQIKMALLKVLFLKAGSIKLNSYQEPATNAMRGYEVPLNDPLVVSRARFVSKFGLKSKLAKDPKVSSGNHQSHQKITIM